MRDFIDIVRKLTEGEVIDFGEHRRRKLEKDITDAEDRLGLDEPRYVTFRFFTPEAVALAKTLGFSFETAAMELVAENMGGRVAEIRHALDEAGVSWREEPFEFDEFDDADEDE